MLEQFSVRVVGPVQAYLSNVAQHQVLRAVGQSGLVWQEPVLSVRCLGHMPFLVFHVQLALQMSLLTNVQASPLQQVLRGNDHVHALSYEQCYLEVVQSSQQQSLGSWKS